MQSEPLSWIHAKGAWEPGSLRLPRDRLLTTFVCSCRKFGPARHSGVCHPPFPERVKFQGPFVSALFCLLSCTFQARLPDARWQQYSPTPHHPAPPATSPLLFNPNLQQHRISRTAPPRPARKTKHGWRFRGKTTEGCRDPNHNRSESSEQ